MKSTVIGRNYVVLRDGSSYQDRMNKNKTDESLRRLSKALNVIQEEISEIYDSNYGLYSLVDSIFDSGGMMTSDGDMPWELKTIKEGIDELAAHLLEHNDVIPSEEETILLEDFGFKRDFAMPRYMFFKTIEDNDDKEVVEELILKEGEEPVRRIRTTIWNKTEFGRSSQSIKYRTLKVGKKLMKAINNQRELMELEKKN